MYNSSNLPLSKKKILKKVLLSYDTTALLVILAAIAPAYLFFGYKFTPFEGGIDALLGFLLVLMVLLFVWGIIYQILYYTNYYYNFADNSAEIKKGVISQSSGYVKYDRIQNIYVDQDILDRILGIYDVHYETAGELSNTYSHVDGLNKANAEALVSFLNKQTQHIGVSLVQPISTISQMAPAEEATKIAITIQRDVILVNTIKDTSRLLVLTLVGSGYVVEYTSIQFSAVWYFIILGFCAVEFLIFMYWVLWYANFKFELKEETCVITEKVLESHSIQIPFYKIQNINVSRSVTERLFGLYTLIIETASDGGLLRKARIMGLQKQDADSLLDFLNSRMQKYTNKSV